jgi:hypothetical protein
LKTLIELRAVGAIALTAFVCLVSVAHAEPLNPVGSLDGYWGWHPDFIEPGGTATCADNPLHIWMSEAGTRYNSQQSSADTFVTSPILGHLPSSEFSAGFLIQYEGEQRLDRAGEPVAWFLVMTDVNRFHWIRRDWAGSGVRTYDMIRCFPSQVS